MSAFLIPETGEIRRRIAARNAGRAVRLSRRLRAVADAANRRQALEALDAVLSGGRGARRDEFLLGAGVRGWLADAEGAIAIARPERGTSDLALFERVSHGAHLRELMPRGCLDRDFRRRARRLGERSLARAFARVPLLLAFRTPPDRTFGPFEVDGSADGEEARAAGEIHIDHPAPLALTLRGRVTLFLLSGGVRIDAGRRAPEIRARPSIGGTGILLARRVASTRGGLRTGAHCPEIGKKLDTALEIIRSVWPEAHAETCAHTHVVVPLRERGTVSYSLPDRPGFSYVNVAGKSMIDLADDLVHEAAHHRLHALEEVEGPLDCDDGEPRYVSPWRRGVRPLHGILHAAYTFCWRAELLRRLLAVRSRRVAGVPLDAVWLRGELHRETAALGSSLRDLADAERRGLLTGPGMAIRRAVARRVMAGDAPG